MNRFAVIKDNKVINVVLWDKVSPWSIEEEIIEITLDSRIGPGWSYDGKDFIPPPEVEPIPATSSTEELFENLLSLLVIKELVTEEEKESIKISKEKEVIGDAGGVGAVALEGEIEIGQ